ncbi:Chromosome partition protein Smc [Oligella sp. MSHR50489EDL]|uniref:ATP-binding protein n=1 Tax=Oligella sp. MSHR50489EDL TaxID=3139409 RepID=UPI003D818332
MIESQLSLYSDSAPSIHTSGADGQVRIAELSVYNWGSFGDRIHTATIDPEGTLITGGNGSGKSTLIDGLMSLLISPGKISFNMAASQGDRRDRTLVSYMRGSYGSSHDGSGTRVMNKRNQAVVTGLRAMYRYDGGSAVTLMAIFYINQTSNHYRDVNRLYFIADENFKLKDLLDAFNGRSIREFKQWINHQPNLQCFDDKFSEYEAIYRQKLAMHNENAPALLARALGLKKIDDLTKLIRELVLEPGQIKEQARYIVDEFSVLVATHDRLTDARAQVQALQGLVVLDEAISKRQELISRLTEESQGLSVFFARKQLAELEQEIADLEIKIAGMEAELKRYEREEEEATVYSEQCHAAYLQVGGDQLDEIRRSLAQVNERITSMLRACERYQTLCQELELDATLDEQRFIANQAHVKEQLHLGEFELARLEEAYLTTKQQLFTLQQQLKSLEDEILAIEQRPNSNIDLKFQQLRDKLAADLTIDPDKLMYIGELIDVPEEEIAWRGAIERALASRKLTLLVPEADYKRVTAWLNQRHLALTLRAQVVEPFVEEGVQFMPGGFLEKLHWRDHSYRAWLQDYLERFDLLCVDSVEVLNRTEFSMTVNGLIHLKQGFFEKKDQHRIDDRRFWQLGFDAKLKLAALKKQAQALQVSKTELSQKTSSEQRAYEGFRNQQLKQEKLLEFDWDSIDLPQWEIKRELYTERLQALEAAEGDLQQAKRRWDTAKETVTLIKEKVSALLKRLGSEDNALKSARANVEQVFHLAQESLSNEVEGRLEIKLNMLNMPMVKASKSIDNELKEQLAKENRQQNTDKETVIGQLGRFRGKERWQAYTVDWPSGFEALADALLYLQKLEEEGLPALVEQYQERLNKNITQSIALFQTGVEAEFSDIRERIARINQVLAKTEFRHQSYLKLNARRDNYPFIKDFNQKMALALGSITDSDQDKRFKLVNDVVSVLAKALESTRVDDERLLDPRKQMSFYAEEIHQETEEVIDVLDSSSGKSGGEKEAFAGTIVAASLAYVLTPKDEETPVYASVFLDEAFSNAAEGVAARVIKVFKALKLHVNLITPYKNLNVARKSARSLILAERNEATHESRLREITWELLDDYQAKSYQALKDQANLHGVQVYDN